MNSAMTPDDISKVHDFGNNRYQMIYEGDRYVTKFNSSCSSGIKYVFETENSDINGVKLSYMIRL